VPRQTNAETTSLKKPFKAFGKNTKMFQEITLNSLALIERREYENEMDSLKSKSLANQDMKKAT